jgi:tetratricopeptide (TPR) repeat protein
MMVVASVAAGLLLVALVVYRLNSNPSSTVIPAKTDPADTAGRLLRARELTNSRDYPSAERLYRKVLQSEPDNLAAVSGLETVLGKEAKKEEIAPLLIQTASIYRDRKDYQKAADLDREALQQDPGNADAKAALTAVLTLINPPPKHGSDSGSTKPRPKPSPKLKFSLRVYSRDIELKNGQELAIDDDRLGGLAQNELKFELDVNQPLPESNKLVRLRWVRKDPDGKTDQIANREIAADSLNSLQPLLSRPRAGEQDIWFEWNGEEVASFRLTIKPPQ